MLRREYDIDTLAAFLSEPLSEEETDDLQVRQREKIKVEGRQPRRIDKRPLPDYFDPSMERPRRNQAIYEAYRDGHTQSSIARHLHLTDAAISIIIKKFRI